jgi:ArsR family transcriptional regulator
MRTIPLITRECCPPFVGQTISNEEAAEMAAAIRVLADPARLRLLSLIASSPDREACVCDLTAPLELSQPTVSHHLKVLTKAGLLAREQRGRWAYFRLVPDRLDIVRRAFSTRSGNRPERSRTAERSPVPTA